MGRESKLRKRRKARHDTWIQRFDSVAKFIYVVTVLTRGKRYYVDELEHPIPEIVYSFMYRQEKKNDAKRD